MIKDYASRPLTPVTLHHLLEMGQKNRLGTAQYVHHELPIRLARRLQGESLVLGHFDWDSRLHLYK